MCVLVWLSISSSLFFPFKNTNAYPSKEQVNDPDKGAGINTLCLVAVALPCPFCRAATVTLRDVSKGHR